MSDLNQNTEQGGNESPEKKPETKQPAPKAESGGGFEAAFKSLQAEKSRVESELATMSKKLAEREKALAEVTTERDGYVRRHREGVLVSKIKAARPGLEEIDIRGRLAIFAEDGKVDRHPEDSKLEEAVKAALELIPENNTQSPSQEKRPAPAQGGGPNGAPQQNGRAQQGKFLI